MIHCHGPTLMCYHVWCSKTQQSVRHFRCTVSVWESNSVLLGETERERGEKRWQKRGEKKWDTDRASLKHIQTHPRPDLQLILWMEGNCFLKKKLFESMSNSNNTITPPFRPTTRGRDKVTNERQGTRERKEREQERFILLALNKYLTDFLRKYCRSHVK